MTAREPGELSASPVATMPRSLNQTLTPEKALIFRITHRSNLPWILENGLHCSRSTIQDPQFENIGNPDLIEKRQSRQVPISPGGTLDEYVPFYFTPCTPMLYNISSGYGGIRQRTNDEIIVLVTSLVELEARGIPFVFTDRHAYLCNAKFFSDCARLDQVDYELLRSRDFRQDPENPQKKERYQAEALVHRHLPVDALLGLACYSQGVKQEVEAALADHGVELATVIRPDWYFR